MSGRSGYRKSHHPLLGRFGVRRVRRPRGEAAPEWRFSLELPTELAFSIAPGPYPGLIGVTIEDGCLIVLGKNKTWLIGQAIAFFKATARDFAFTFSRHARISRTMDANAATGPPRRGEPDVIEITVATGRPVIVLSGPGWMRTQVH